MRTPAGGSRRATPEQATPRPRAESGAGRKSGWFQRLKAGLTKSSSRLSQDIAGLFTKRKLDADTLQELEDLLIQADLGVETAMRITAALAKGRYNKEIAPDEVRAVLAAEVERALAPVARPLRFRRRCTPACHPGRRRQRHRQDHHHRQARAPAGGRKARRSRWPPAIPSAPPPSISSRSGVSGTGAEVVAANVGADAAGLAFDALTKARENASDVLLIDTAGRLQNKQALMDELEKVIRVLRKIDPTAPHQVLLVLDATTGQNALNQVEVFKDKAGVTGLVMTKLDGTARGGILVAISAKFGLPVHAIGIGEGVEDLAAFDAGEFARAIALS